MPFDGGGRAREGAAVKHRRRDVTAGIPDGGPLKSKAQALGHPLHPMLVMFPTALLPVALIFDLVHLATGNALWWSISFWTLLAGVVGALLAILPGLLDYGVIPRGTEARRIATQHMVTGLTLTAISLVSLLTRDFGRVPHTLNAWIPVGLLLVANGALVLQGWWGGELVYRHAVGVHTEGHGDAAIQPGHHEGETRRPRPGGGSG